MFNTFLQISPYGCKSIIFPQGLAFVILKNKKGKQKTKQQQQQLAHNIHSWIPQTTQKALQVLD